MPENIFTPQMTTSLRFSLLGIVMFVLGMQACQCEPESAQNQFFVEQGDFQLMVQAEPFALSLRKGDQVLGQSGSLQAQCSGFALAIRADEDMGDRYARPDTPPSDLLWYRASSAKLVRDDAAGLKMQIQLDSDDGREAKTAQLTVKPGREGFFDLDIVPDAEAQDIALLQSCFVLVDDEHVVGGGERFDGVDLRGRVIPLAFALPGPYDSGSNETHAPVPFATTSRGFGILVESEHPGAIDLSEDGAMRWRFQGEHLPLRLRGGAGSQPMLDNAAAQARRMGLPPEPPLWALAPMQWRNALEVDVDEQGQVTRSGRDRLLDDAQQLRALDIPTTTLWIDAPWETGYNTFAFNDLQFPDAAGMLSELESLGFRSIVWATEHINDSDDSGQMFGMPVQASLDLFNEFKQMNYFVQSSNGGLLLLPWSRGHAAFVDFTNPAADLRFGQEMQPLLNMGIRGFKLDYGEEMRPDLLGQAMNNLPIFHDGSTTAVQHSRYARLYHECFIRELQQRWPADHFIITRTGGIFDQVNGDAIWPGDLDASFERSGVMQDNHQLSVGGLPAAISAQLSLAMSAYPLYGSDIGGYRGADPSTELLLRWAQFAALSPIMQLGGGGGGDNGHNPWSDNYSAEAVPIYRRYARLHMDLVPSLRAWIHRASIDGWPFSIPLGVYAPDDREAWADVDAFVLGGRLLVAPVVVDGARTRRVHFPQGDWLDWWTGEFFAGPQNVEVDAPLDTLPLYQKAGSVLWLGDPRLMTLVAASDAQVADYDAFGKNRLVRLSAGPDDWSVLVDRSYASQHSEPGQIVIDIANSVSRRVVVELLLRPDLGPNAQAQVQIDGQNINEISEDESLWSCQTPCLKRSAGRMQMAVERNIFEIIVENY